MQAKQKKIIDSSTAISKGGRAESYWRNKTVKTRSSGKIIAPVEIRNVDQFDLIKKYHLQGFEYGNWVNNNDRNDKLKAAAYSLRDLSRILQTTNVGLFGKVGIAFGARGKTPALAHFEPSTFMINLTKKGGDGSLAHEYGHAIDYFFGMYIDQSKKYTSLVGGNFTAKVLKDNTGGRLRNLANRIVNEIITDNSKAVTDLSTSYKKLIEAKNGTYWRSRNEIWARFFEQYIAYRLSALKIVNPFLSKTKYESVVYLTKKDFERVRPLMDKFTTEVSKHLKQK